MILLKNVLNIFKIAELRRKLVFTFAVLIVYRIGNHIPVIGIDLQQLQQFMSQKSGLGGLFSYLDMFSGGSLKQCTLFALGIMPYITASIMMQILSMSIPYLEELSKEGEYGKKIINQYTRYLALGISIMQSFSYALVVENYGLVLDPGWAFRLLFMFSLTIGSIVVMWLGEQIALHGVGSGSSMIIFAGIVARFPHDIITTLQAVKDKIMDPVIALVLLAIFVGMAACIVFLEKGDRKVPVQYTRRVVGQRMYAGQSSYIPFKINTAGIMPVIFSNAVLNVPLFMAAFLASRFTIFKWISESLTPTGLVYNVIDFILIIFFSFFYTAMVYNPDELAENIKKGGGFIPGIRPGKKTAEFFNYLLTRLGLVGAIYLGCLAIAPNLIYVILRLPFYLSTLSGTGMLIMVGVALETASQVESYLIEHRYEGFLTSGKMQGRGSR